MLTNSLLHYLLQILTIMHVIIFKRLVFYLFLSNPFIQDIENDSPEPSDWDRYAAEEYEILVAEESGSVQLQEG